LPIHLEIFPCAERSAGVAAFRLVKPGLHFPFDRKLFTIGALLAAVSP
jgi:hypothetical protein